MTGVKSREEKITEMIAHLVMIILTILALAPFLLLVSGSFTESKAIVKFGYQFWPKEFSIEAYRYIAAEWSQIGRTYLITIFITVVGTAASLVLVSLMGYGLIHKDVPGLKIVFILILITLMFNGGIVSSYMIYTNVFHIKNTIWALIIPNLLLNGFNILLVKNYLQQNIPGELMEAAEIDGAGQLLIYQKIVLPLSTPILATIGLLTAITYWNDWTNGLYYITDARLYSVQLLLNEINNNVQFLASKADLAHLTSGLPTATIRLAIAVAGILPIVLIYPFFQGYFVKGITMGAVKG